MQPLLPLISIITSVAAYVAQAPNFAITVKLALNSPLIAAQGWNLTSYHITPCYDYATFIGDESGRTFYANGTVDEFTSHTSNILSDGGTPPWPWGTVVSPANSTDSEGRRNVYINCGIGTPGVEVKTDGPFPLQERDPRIVYGSGQFYVCNSTLLYGPAITLYYREASEMAPGNCSDVELQTRCLDDGTEHEYQANSWCYK